MNRADKKKPGILITPGRKERPFSPAQLIKDGAIIMDDLSEFSEGLQEQSKSF